MIRINVVAEGETEQAFVLNCLSPHLTKYNVLCTSTLPGRRGGDLRYLRFKNELLRLISHDKTSYFTCMIDFYAFDHQFPGFYESQKINNVRDRILFLESELARDIQQNRFIPYIQLHEFEALLFSDINKIQSYFLEVPSMDRRLHSLREEVKAYASPEDINTGIDTAPSKRLIRHIPEYSRSKATAGPFIAAEIGLEVLRIRCPHFGAWLEKMENLV